MPQVDLRAVPTNLPCLYYRYHSLIIVIMYMVCPCVYSSYAERENMLMHLKLPLTTSARKLSLQACPSIFEAGCKCSESTYCSPNCQGDPSCPSKCIPSREGLPIAFSNDCVLNDEIIFNQDYDSQYGGIKLIWRAAKAQDQVKVTSNKNMRFFSYDMTSTSPTPDNKIYIEGLEFSGGLSQANGGAMFLKPDSEIAITFVRCIFSNNKAIGGGGVFLQGPAKLRFIDCIFRNNVATGKGGAIYGDGNHYSSYLELKDSIFLENTASSDGGAVFATNMISLMIMNCTFTGNSAAGGHGGAISVGGGYSHPPPTLTLCIFVANNANLNDGGAIYLNGIGLECIQCQFHDNVANIGGAVAGGGSPEFGPVITFRKCIFGNNAANSMGADIYVMDTSPIFSTQYYLYTEIIDTYFTNSNSVRLPTSPFNSDSILRLCRMFGGFSPACSQDFQCLDLKNSGNEIGVRCQPEFPWIRYINSTECTSMISLEDRDTKQGKHLRGCPDGYFNISIHGDSFGIDGAKIHIGDKVCHNSTHMDSQGSHLTCVVEPGIGLYRGEIVVYRKDGESSLYYAPHGYGNEDNRYISAYIDTHAPTVKKILPNENIEAAGSYIYIFGKYFGQSSSPIYVTIDGKVCHDSQWINATALRAIAPQWGGKDLLLRLRIGNQSDVQPKLISYRQPVINRIIAPIYGGIVRIFGKEFGGSSSIPISIISFGRNLQTIACENPVRINSMRMDCVYRESGSIGLESNRYFNLSINGYASEPFQLTYEQFPSIRNVYPRVLNPEGGTEVTLFGSNFGFIDSYPEATIGSRPCSKTIWISDVKILCISPPNVGYGFVVIVSRGAKSWSPASSDPLLDINATVNYMIPQIHSVIPAFHASINGNQRILIIGRYFGVKAAVESITIAGNICDDVLFKNHSALSCNSPAGGGRGLNIQILVASQTNIPNTLFNYGKPVILSLVPAENARLAGGHQLIVQGKGFGNAGILPTVTVEKNTCSLPLIISNTQLVCTYPAGVGSRLSVSVTIHNQTSDISELSKFSYIAPVVEDIDSGSRNASGGYYLYVNGLNFGTRSTPLIARVGQANCSTSEWLSNTRLSCIVPPGSGVKRSVQVLVGNQWSSANRLFDYSPPSVEVVKPSAGLNPVGGSLIHVHGCNFGNGNAMPKVKVHGQECSNIEWSSDTLIRCQAPSGVGANHLIQVEVDGQSSIAAISVAYAIPQIMSILPLRDALVDGGQLLTITGVNFGVSDSSPTVTVGGILCALPEWKSNVKIVCITPPGGGRHLDVRVSVAGQMSPSNNKLFHYANAEVLSAIPSKGDTQGGTLIIKGKGFGHDTTSSYTIKIGGAMCTDVIHKSNVELECLYAAYNNGPFADLDILLTMSGQPSTMGQNLFSYNIQNFAKRIRSEMSLNGYIGSEVRSNSSIKDAFRASLSSVLNVGSSQITLTSIDSVALDSSLRLLWSVRQLLDKVVKIGFQIATIDANTANSISAAMKESHTFEFQMVAQLKSIPATKNVDAASVTISPVVEDFVVLYTECHAGKELSTDRKDCIPCRIGYFQAFVSSAPCTACPPGADCTATGTDIPAVLRGWYRKNASSPYIKTSNYYQCPLKDACRGGNVSRGDALCKNGYTGVVCGICDTKRGFVKQGNKCSECIAGAEAKPSFDLIVPLLSAGILFVLFASLYFMSRPALTNQQIAELQCDLKIHAENLAIALRSAGVVNREKFGHVFKEVCRNQFSIDELNYVFKQSDKNVENTITWEGFMSYIDEATRNSENLQEKKYGGVKVMLGFVQCLGLFPTVFTIHWPGDLLVLMKAMQAFTLDFFDIIGSAACHMSTGFLTIFLGHVTIPIVFAVVFYVARKLSIACLRKASTYSKESVVRRCNTLLLVVFFAMHPGLSSTIFRLFRCDTYDSISHLTADLSVQCSSDTWSAHAAIGVLGMIIYVFAIPLYQLRQVLKYKAWLHFEKGMDRCKHREVYAMYGFLYDNYKKEYYYFDFIDLLRKTLLVGALVFMQENGVSQLLIDNKTAQLLGVQLTLTLAMAIAVVASGNPEAIGANNPHEESMFEFLMLLTNFLSTGFAFLNALLQGYLEFRNAKDILPWSRSNKISIEESHDDQSFRLESGDVSAWKRDKSFQQSIQDMRKLLQSPKDAKNMSFDEAKVAITKARACLSSLSVTVTTKDKTCHIQGPKLTGAKI